MIQFNLIQFSNKQLDELNTPFALDLYNEDLTGGIGGGGGYNIPRQG